MGINVTINATQLSAQVVLPTLQMLAQVAGIPYSDAAYHLCMGTIAQESLLGTYLVQASGPALGIIQVQPATLAGIIAGLRVAHATALATLATPATPDHNVVANLPYAVAILRFGYWQSPLPLPPDTISGLFLTPGTCCYKDVWNTPAGAATLAQWQQNWQLTGIDLSP
jgi:hypothetical protein